MRCDGKKKAKNKRKLQSSLFALYVCASVAQESHAFGTSPGELVAKPAIRGATSVPDSLDKIGRDDSPSSSPSGRQSASGSFGRRLSSPFLSALRRLSSGSLSASQDDLINPMRSGTQETQVAVVDVTMHTCSVC